jgi:hypothetical protein
MIPVSAGPPDPARRAGPAADLVVDRYRAFFALLDWSRVPERDPRRPWPGRPPHPRVAYVKALLVKLCEGKESITALRAFLLEHPRLVLDLGFRPVGDATQPDGFDVARTVPGARWLRHQQQTLDHTILRSRLGGTVAALQAEIPGLGTTVAVDVKHIYAWVRENNPKEDIPHRFDPIRQPRGDPDCQLGVKRRGNRDEVAAGGQPAPKEYLWGYGTAIVSATDSRYGDVVLAERTQPFNRQDVTYFQPVHQQAVAHLGRHPTYLAAAAAFDAWSVYQPYAERGGLAAIARNARGPSPPHDANGHPCCARGWVMTPAGEVRHEDGYRARVYRCPLLRPRPTGDTCAHPQFPKGGCRKRVNIEAGGQMRWTLDRRSDAYRAVYRQRTSAERINSQAKALGIERPKARRAATVHRLNTLIYIVINVRALQRARARNAHATPPTMLC